MLDIMLEIILILAIAVIVYCVIRLSLAKKVDPTPQLRGTPARTKVDSDAKASPLAGRQSDADTVQARGKNTLPEANIEFLPNLSKKERCAVTGLGSHVYQAVIQAKNSGYTITSSISTDNPYGVDLVQVLWSIDVQDLERLMESVALSVQADEIAASNPTRARKLYGRCMKLNPHDAVAAMTYGVLVAQDKNYREALRWLERAADLDPWNPRIQRNLAAVQSYL
jgi:predicted Zn-dependent protease